MAKSPTTKQSTVSQLTADNKRLRAENERLQRLVATKAPATPPSSPRTIRTVRSIAVIFFIALSVALLIVGNLLFWTGNTLVKSDRFAETVTPLVQNTEVQKAVASYTTTQLYNSVNVDEVIQSALPPRAEFLAPTIAGQLQGYTQKTLQGVLANPTFQDKWNTILVNSHDRFISTVEKSGGDGVIDVSELYTQLSGSLKDTKLSFLADRKLPAKVGDIQVASGDGIAVLHRVIVKIDLWRTLAIILFVLTAAAAIYLSRRRRRAVLQLALYGAFGLFVVLVALRVVREMIAGSVQPIYAEAARQASQIVFHPFVVQTTTLVCALLLVALVAWLSAPYRSATFVRSRVQLLFAGKLHQAIFGGRENGFTRWIGAHKHFLQATVLVIVGVLLLINRITVNALIVYAIITLVLVLLIELLGAPSVEVKQPSNRKIA